MPDESKKVALITGSAVRLGKFVAEMLAKDGWKIALHYFHSKEEAYDLAKNLIDFADVMVFQADLTQASQAQRLLAEVNEQLGPVNLLLNNASIYKNDNLFNLDTNLLEQNLNIHLLTPIYLAKAFAEQKVDGNIINIIDSEITRNLKKFFSYSLSKKALFNLTKMLAVDLAPNVRVNAIAPGAILFKEGQSEEIFNRFITDSPLGKKPSLNDLYRSINFLIDTKSITGQCIFLDGGKHLV